MSYLTRFEKTLLITLSLSFVFFLPVVFHVDVHRDLPTQRYRATNPWNHENQNKSIDFVTLPKDWPIFQSLYEQDRCEPIDNVTLTEEIEDEKVVITNQCPLKDSDAESYLSQMVSEEVVENIFPVVEQAEKCALNESYLFSSEVEANGFTPAGCLWSPMSLTLKVGVALTLGVSGMAAFTARQFFRDHFAPKIEAEYGSL